MMNLRSNAELARQMDSGDDEIVSINRSGRPVTITMLGHCHHFADAETYRHNRSLQNMKAPMDKMIESMVRQQLERPKY